MPWSAPKFKPGINTTDEGLANEGGIVDANCMRVHQGEMQCVGGWQPFRIDTFPGTARASHDWRTREGLAALAWGTESKLYVDVKGVWRDITPNLHQTVLTDAFTTVSGSPTITVYLDYHLLAVGDEVVFSNHQSTIGGLTIEGTYSVTSVETPHRFTITHGSNASSTVSTPGGGNVDFVAALPAGLSSTPVSGYGSGQYGDGNYGGTLTTRQLMRTWSLANWGEFLLANPSGFGIFEFQPELAYPDLSFNGTFTGNADGWGLGTGWAYSSNAVAKTAGTGSNLSQDVDGILEGGRYYLCTFTVTRTAGELRLRMNAGETPAVIDIGTASAAITKSGTYTRLFLCPAAPQDIVFEADSSFAGTVDNVSYQLMDKAYRITTAPPRVDAMFVDPRGLVVALGTTLVDGSYSATAVRCSDIGNNRSWVPDTDSLASEKVLNGVGGRLMAGLSTRQQNIIWSDQRVLSLQYQGVVGDAFAIEDLGGGCGLISRNAMCEHNGFVFWMTNTKQFRIFRGVNVAGLGIPEVLNCPMQAEIFDNIDYDQSLKIHAGINPEFSEAWFFVPDKRDGDECSRVYTVAWTEGTEDSGAPWMKHQMARTTWRPSGTFANPLGFTAPDDDGNSVIMDHEVGKTANGAPLGDYFETAPFDVGEGEMLMFLSMIEPHFSHQSGNVGITLIGWMYQNSTPFEYPTELVAEPTTTQLFPRFSARRMALRIRGLTTGGFWRYGKLIFDGKARGAKR